MHQQIMCRILICSAILFIISCDYITDFKQPEIRIISPKDGDTLLSLGNLELKIELEGSDNRDIDHIDLLLDDKPVHSFTSAPYGYETSDTTKLNHTVNIRARAFDKGGNWRDDAVAVYINFYEPQIEEIGFYDTPGQCYEVVVSGDYAFLADGTAGLRIIDVSNPYQPTEIGYCNTPDEAYDLAVAGNYAYVADGHAGLRIIDITNHANPYEIGYYDPPGYNASYGVCIEGNYAYLTNDSRGLCIVDITNPTNPVEIGRTETYLYKLIKINDYVYAFKEPGSLIVINVSNPYLPYKSAELDIQDPSSIWFRNITHSTNYLYTAADDFLIIEPVSLQIKASCSSHGDYDVVISDSIAYITGNRFGKGTLSIVNIANPTEPAEVYWWFTPVDEAYGVSRLGEYLLVASGNMGLRILKVKLCP